jgi:hypothetical protein
MITSPRPSAGRPGPSDTERAGALFGPPARVYHVDGRDIEVWNRNLLSDVQRATRMAGQSP